MSIYATILSFDADDEDALGPPYVYQASHVLPTPFGERAGWLELAAIPSHCSADGKSLVDFLRIDSSPNDDGDPSVTLLIDRKQVLRLRQCLTDWLQREFWEDVCPTCEGESWACGDERHKCGCGAPLSEHEGGRCPN